MLGCYNWAVIRLSGGRGEGGLAWPTPPALEDEAGPPRPGRPPAADHQSAGHAGPQQQASRTRARLSRTVARRSARVLRSATTRASSLRVRIFQASTVQAEKVCIARLLAWWLAVPTGGCVTTSYLARADIARKNGTPLIRNAHHLLSFAVWQSGPASCLGASVRAHVDGAACRAQEAPS
jgi:hypothetical protein